MPALRTIFNSPVSYEVNPGDPGGPPIAVKNGIYNTFTPQLAVTENIFSPELMYAAKNAPLLVQQARQSNDSAQINVVATISTAFFNLLNTITQINVLKEDTAQFYKTVQDAYHQYVGGIVDKTDYEQATITLNNSKAQLRQAIENVKPQYASLKQIMGFPPKDNFRIVVDTAKMMKEIYFDTTQQLQYEKRIEFQLLETAKKIQEQNINYNRFRFLPSLVSLFTHTMMNMLIIRFPNSFPNRILFHSSEHLSAFLYSQALEGLKVFSGQSCNGR